MKCSILQLLKRKAMTLTIATSLALLRRFVWQRALVVRLCLPTIRYTLLIFLPKQQKWTQLCIKNFRTLFQIIEGTDKFGSDNQGSNGTCILYCFHAKYSIATT